MAQLKNMAELETVSKVGLNVLTLEGIQTSEQQA